MSQDIVSVSHQNGEAVDAAQAGHQGSLEGVSFLGSGGQTPGGRALTCARSCRVVGSARRIESTPWRATKALGASPRKSTTLLCSSMGKSAKRNGVAGS